MRCVWVLFPCVRQNPLECKAILLGESYSIFSLDWIQRLNREALGESVVSATQTGGCIRSCIRNVSIWICNQLCLPISLAEASSKTEKYTNRREFLIRRPSGTLVIGSSMHDRETIKANETNMPLWTFKKQLISNPILHG